MVTLYTDAAFLLLRRGTALRKPSLPHSLNLSAKHCCPSLKPLVRRRPAESSSFTQCKHSLSKHSPKSKTWSRYTMAPFNRLVRFKNPAGNVFYGEVPESADNLATQETLLGSNIPVYTGATPFDTDFTLTDQKEEIAEVCHQQCIDSLLCCDSGCYAHFCLPKQTKARENSQRLLMYEHGSRFFHRWRRSPCLNA